MKAQLGICFTFLAMAVTGGSMAEAAGSAKYSPSSVVSPGAGPRANPSVIGLALSGVGTSLQPPTSPTARPYSPDCHTLIDPGFTGVCVMAIAPTGTVAGIVEREKAALPPRPSAGSAAGSAASSAGGSAGKAGAGKNSPEAQERDLVWRRHGPNWALALVRVFQSRGPSALVWADDVERDHDTKLVFVTSSDRSGFGAELDVVEGTGAVTLYRSLGQGFTDVPAAGGLVTYVPGWTEEHGPANAYDQTLVGYSNGSWRVFSEQYVPDGAALRQHRGSFWDSRAVAGA